MKKPVNNQQHLDFIWAQMAALSNKEVTVEEAKAQAALAKQANNAQMIEMERTNTELKVANFNLEHGTNIKLRNIESEESDEKE